MTDNKKKTAYGAVLVLSITLLPGCLPLTTPTVISLVVDGFSFMATGKTVADHALSELAQKDCSVGRAVFTGTDICFEDTEPPVIALGDISDGTALPLAPASGEQDEAAPVLPVY